VNRAAPTTGFGTTASGSPTAALTPHITLQLKLATAGGCTCSNRAAYLLSGVDTLCQASYMGGTAGTYKAADCEKVTDNSGASS